MSADKHNAALAITKQYIETAMREMLERLSDPEERRAGLAPYLSGRFDLDPILVARFCGESIFSVQFDGREPKEERQALLMAANREDAELCKFLLYAKVGDEYKTGGGAAPMVVTRRVS